ncbi:MAG: endolytic transglycosylase MltG [Nakamurella sp.]
MGSHRHPDDADNGNDKHIDAGADMNDGAEIDARAETGTDDTVAEGDGADINGGGDHFGLFDDHAVAAAEDVTPAGELDLSDLRDVLAGRREAVVDTGRGTASRAGTGPVSHDAAGPRVHGRGGEVRTRRRRHPVRSSIIALVVLALIAGGVTFGVLWWQERTAAPQDWAGTGSQTLVVRVQSGDGLYDVGQTLVSAGVVASIKTFVAVATDDGRLDGLRPGYYRVHEHSSAQSTTNDLANPSNRLGQLRIVPGQTLADIATVSTTGKKSTKQGIMSKIVDACVPTNGAAQCFTVDQIWQAAVTSPLSTLGVVGWAMDPVSAVSDPRRRLEGLILPGDYDIAPGATAQQALSSVVQASAAQWNTTGIVAAAAKQHLTPYQLATVASLVQAEAIGPDMPKAARVIYNRLDDKMDLQFDSTVNYGLDRASIATTSAERLDDANAYSTYAHSGLTPTPIGAPGPDALDAADDPATGTWLYFVAIDLDGNTCFSTTIDEHKACIAKARANGVFG